VVRVRFLVINGSQKVIAAFARSAPSGETRLSDGSKIVFVLPALRMGGAEQVVRLLAREMMNRHQVLVVSTGDGGAMQSVLKKDGIPVVVLGSKRSFVRPITWLLSLAWSVAQLRRVFTDFRPDVINMHLLGPELETLLAARLAGIDKVVVTVHNTYPLFSSQRLSDRIRQLRLRSSYVRSRAVIAVSDEVRDWAVRHGIVRPDQVYVVPNGIDLSKIVDRKDQENLRIKNVIPLESFVFVSVAALVPEKGHSVLLEAIAQIPEKARDVSVFLLVGEGPERQSLGAQALALGVQGCVRFLGLRNDVPELLALSDVFVISSHYEGLSLALMEAMATGLPIVSTQVAGSTLLVKNGINGFLVPPNDSTGLSKILLYCIQHRDSICELGRAARAMVMNEYSCKHMAQLTEAVFAIFVGVG